MKAIIKINKKKYKVDFSKGIDLSFPLKSGAANPKCFYAPDPIFEPVRTEGFVGSTAEGSPVNFYNVFFNPHGNGTHTECVGHISKEKYSVGSELKDFMLYAQLVHIKPKHNKQGDTLVTKALLKKHIKKTKAKALIISTGIHGEERRVKDFSYKNPTYISPKGMEYIKELGIEHLLVDMPSVDREKDEGKLAAHKIFWAYPDKVRKNCTITELIFVPKGIKDGFYLLNMQVPNFSLDAAPSRPVIYNLNP